MNIYNPRATVRITEIRDTRTWWQRSIFSKMDWAVIGIVTVYGVFAGAALGWLFNG